MTDSPLRVLGLLRPCRPSAIRGLVVAINIDPVNGIRLRRAPSHVFEKGAEAVSPTRADLDAAPTPVFKPECLRVFTSLDHVSPGSIFEGSASVARRAVPKPDRWPDFALKTPATSDVSAAQIAARDDVLLPAVASGQVMKIRAALDGVLRQHNKPEKSQPNHWFSKFMRHNELCQNPSVNTMAHGRMRIEHGDL